MLTYKGIPFRRVDLLPGVSRYIVRALGFPEGTVPAIVIDGRKVQLSRTIAQELDRLVPEPPLFPADPEQRAAVLEAERFGDEELQSTVRSILVWAIRRRAGGAAQLPGGIEARRAARDRREDGRAVAGPRGAYHRRDRQERPRRAREAARAAPARRRRDRRRDDRRRTPERRRLSDRREPEAGDDDPGPAAVDRLAACGRARPPRGPRVRRRHAADDPRGLARALRATAAA